jgi:hypothetical protein
MRRKFGIVLALGALALASTGGMFSVIAADFAPQVVAKANEPLELTGIAVDRATNKPLEGAWVLASYHEKRTDYVSGVAQDCVKTRGMTTGPDGAFHFPVEKRDGMSPQIVTAIMPGYYMYTVKQPTREQWKRQDAESYSNFVILMDKQDRAHPIHVNNLEAFCPWAKRSEDTVAADKYLQIWIEELKRFGGTPKQIQSLERVISEHQALGSGQK